MDSINTTIIAVCLFIDFTTFYTKVYSHWIGSFGASFKDTNIITAEKPQNVLYYKVEIM